MTAISYKEFYNKGRGLPEPKWGEKATALKGIPLQCPTCGSLEMYYSASPDDPEEIFTSTVRCKNCGQITDWFEAYKQRIAHSTDTPRKVIYTNPLCSGQGHVLG